MTTDTKIIPLQIEKYLLLGHDLAESFRLAVCDFEGSHAIAMVSSVEPGKTFLALKGSGQSIYVGITPDRYLFSSELYGLVEGTSTFVKMDGERPPDPIKPETTGQIFILDQEAPGGIAGITGASTTARPLQLGEKEIRKAEITTRDIDRGDYPHYFLKEITEAAQTVRKTLRGKYRIERGREEEGPSSTSERTSSPKDREGPEGEGGSGRSSSSVTERRPSPEAPWPTAMRAVLKGSGIRVEAQIASELSGFSSGEGPARHPRHRQSPSRGRRPTPTAPWPWPGRGAPPSLPS